MLFQMLTGVLPFRGESMSELMYKIANDEAPDLRQSRPDLPAPLADIVARALSKQADLRYQDGDEFARDLLEIAASVPDEALSSQLSSSADSDAAMQRTTPQTPTVRISR